MSYLRISGLTSGQRRLTRRPSAVDASFSLTTSPIDRIVSPGSSTNTTLYDANVVQHTLATVATDQKINVISTVDPQPSFSSLTPATATIDSSGVASSVASGAASVIVTSRRVSKRIDFSAAYAAGATSYVYSSYRTGSLAKYLADQMNALCGGVSPALISDPSTWIRQKWYNELWSGWGGSYTQNTGNLIYTSGISGYTPPTPSALNHVVSGNWALSAHFSMRCVHVLETDSNSKKLVPSSSPPGYVYIDYNAAGTNATPYIKLLPSNWASFIRAFSVFGAYATFPLWALRFNVGNGAYMGQISDQFWLQPVEATGVGGTGVFTIDAPNHWPTISPFCFPRIETGGPHPTNVGVGGDSFSPLFIIINGEPIFFGQIYGYGGTCYSAMQMSADIQATMNSLAAANSIANETITSVDLTNTSGIGNGAVTAFTSF